ncbi:M16 family metallopeptidase [Roseivirga misakiensis]|uniref:Peptidase M16 n=1 Tax=Roseivirga misakiensis TaxID=1563681 RepID=A0A1E5SYJ7_9BACT|nr:pitrilysin family protein [Roseivirga misakiensis]OEK04204.1 peptidase M16 [Roseivirga misakiensis]
MKKLKFNLIIALIGSLIFWSCESTSTTEKPEFKVDYEKFTLDNGLEVILHVDKSDPVVAVALTAHVGSAREIEGRTGFAHLFEHLLFLESENLGKGGLDKMSARIGGSGANGSTSRDRTNYFQTVPKDALEKMIWAEADKLGWFINTVTDPVLAKEKQVVKNEKRQSVDNRPYGHTSYVIDKALYPEDHPYNWQVIGSLEDLQAATVNDVKQFFRRWYVPNNTTLVIAGDFESAQAKEWVQKYFDEIPRGEEITDLPKRAGVIDETIKLYHEDNFARLPELTMVWPTVELYHPDSYALNVLGQYLARGKQAPFYQVLVENEQLTSGVRMGNRASELAGQFQLSVRAFPDKNLDDVATAVQTAFAKFETEGIPQKDLDRIKAGQETGFYNGLSSVLGKGFQLAQYNIFAKDPGFVKQDVENILNVTAEDVNRVYNKYIKGKNFIATSFVPKGRKSQALSGSVMANVVEEKIVQGAEERFDASIQAEYERTPSTFDRTVEPPYGNAPNVAIPEVWKAFLINGMKVLGIENDEVPLVQFNLTIKGGLLLDDIDKVGVANLTANLMTQGTQNRTPKELEEAIAQLGASINVFAGTESISVTGNTLRRNYEKTMELVEEILLQPRWDEKEFNLRKQSIVSSIKQQEANPNAVANNAYSILIYGKDNIRSKNILGSEASVNSITIDDLKNYYSQFISPSVATMHVVGDISQDDVMSSLKTIEEDWAAKAVDIPVYNTPSAPDKSQVFFYDVPNAKQSVLQIGYPALAATDDDYYPATVMNYILGGGGFASQLTQQLREGKGYTYGIRSGFSGSTDSGAFTISSGVRTNVTYESTQLVKDILADYGNGYDEQDLATTKSFLIKSNARAFETAGSKLNMLQNISRYGWEDDYVKDREAIVQNMTVDKIKALSEKYLNPDKMFWLVVGDAKTQMRRLEKLGYGKPVLINEMVSPEQQ